MDRHNGGWTAAMRCACRAKGWSEDDWGEIEDAYDTNKWVGPLDWEDKPPLEENVGNGDPRHLPDSDDNIPANLLTTSTSAQLWETRTILTLVTANDGPGSHHRHPLAGPLLLLPPFDVIQMFLYISPLLL